MGMLDAFKPRPLTPVCSWCARIRVDTGRWQVTANPQLQPGAPYTSSCICPDCRHKNFSSPQPPQSLRP